MKKTKINPLAKWLALLIIIAIIISTCSAIRSLWFNRFSDDFADRFVYENVATVFGFLGIAFSLILATLQKNVYWGADRKAQEWKERQAIFETSYKLGLLIVIFALWWISGTVHNVPTIITNSTFGSVPGHLYWLPINLATTLFALPLIIAVRKSR